MPSLRVGALYARYGKFEVHGILRTEISAAPQTQFALWVLINVNTILLLLGSLKESLTTFYAFFNGSVDIHYPAIEMSNKQGISCVFWNNYVKNYLASTDFDVVKVCIFCAIFNCLFYWKKKTKKKKALLSECWPVSVCTFFLVINGSDDDRRILIEKWIALCCRLVFLSQRFLIHELFESLES